MKCFYVLSLFLIGVHFSNGGATPLTNRSFAPQIAPCQLICRPIRLAFGDNQPFLIEYGAGDRVARITDSEYGYYETFEYNAEGKVVRIDYRFGVNNSLLERCIFEYVGTALVKRKHYSVDGEGNMTCLGHRMEYTLDEQGRIIKLLWVGGTENVPYFYTYNESGNVTKVHRGDALFVEYKAHDTNKQPLFHVPVLKFSNMIGTRNGEMLGVNNPTEVVIKDVPVAVSYNYNINKYPVCVRDGGGIFNKTVSYSFD